MAILKVETDIIVNISASLEERAGIFVIMSVRAFRTDVIKSPKQRLETYCFCSVSYYYYFFFIIIIIIIILSFRAT